METISNYRRVTISSCVNNEEAIRQATTLYNKWHQLGFFSRIVRYFAWTATIVTAITATVYYCFFSSHFWGWFSLLLAVASVTAIAVMACGLMVLLLKPFFWHRRKKAKRVHAQLIEIEGNLLSEDVLSTQKPVADYICLQSLLQKNNDSDFPANTLFDDYKDATCKIYNNTVYVRELQMDKARWGEWCWVMSACLVLIVALAIIIAAAILTVLIFVLLLWAVIAFNSPSDNYTYRDYDFDTPTTVNKFSFFRSYFNTFHGRFLKISKAISTVKTSIKDSLIRKTATKLMLIAKGIALPNTITLPYWPKRGK